MLEVPVVIRCVLLCMLEAVKGALCLLKVFEVPEVIRCVLLCMLEAVLHHQSVWMRFMVKAIHKRIRPVMTSNQLEGGFSSGFRNFHCGSFLVAARHCAAPCSAFKLRHCGTVAL